MNDKVLYAELTPQEFRERLKEAPVAYLPLGTLEWHGEHLPLGADGLQSAGFFERLAREVGGIVLPMLFLGPDRREMMDGQELYGMDVYHNPKGEHRYESQQLAGSAYWVPEETFTVILEAVMKQLKRAGFRMVIGHGHGPSTGFFRDHSAEWLDRYGLICHHCWGEHEPGYGIQTDHAAMNETSLVMALRPELVQMERITGTPDWPLAVGGVDPRDNASPEVGEKSMADAVERMAETIRRDLNKGDE